MGNISAGEVLLVEGGDLDVLFGPFPDAFLFFIGECLDDFCGYPEDKGTRGHDGVFCNNRSGPDDGPAADDGPIQNCCFHADEAFILDGAGVNHGKVSDGDVLADVDPEVVGKVENTTILNIGAFSDYDLFDISTDDAIWPDGGFRPEGYGPDHNRTLCHVGTGVDLRGLRQKALKAIFDIHREKGVFSGLD